MFRSAPKYLTPQPFITLNCSGLEKFLATFTSKCRVKQIVVIPWTKIGSNTNLDDSCPYSVHILSQSKAFYLFNAQACRYSASGDMLKGRESWCNFISVSEEHRQAKIELEVANLLPTETRIKHGVWVFVLFFFLPISF